MSAHYTKATPRRWSIRINSHPITPPMALMSMVSRLIGIGAERNRFVRKMRTNPIIALMSSAHKKRIPVSMSIAPNNPTTTKSTTHSISAPPSELLARPSHNRF
jgi:hypothetical protein